MGSEPRYRSMDEPRPGPADAEAVQYEPKDAIAATTTATMVTGFAGLFMSSVQNALARQNYGARGVFTRTGGTIAAFGRAIDGPPHLRPHGSYGWVLYG